MNKHTHTITDLVNQLNKIDFTSTKNGSLISSSFIVSYNAKIVFDHITNLYALLPQVNVTCAISKTRAYGWDLSNSEESNEFLVWFATKQSKVTAAEYSKKDAQQDAATALFYSL
tara:strand:+ start:866 stop:1210 length:345 start_codon:yes stop_codon:yes gene_type:complete